MSQSQNPKRPRRLTAAEWAKTPYAKSEARDPDRSILDLLRKYNIEKIQNTLSHGPSGRRSFEIRFQLGDRCYRVGMEVLDVQNVPEDNLLRQVKRAVFHFLKIALEFSTVFCPLDQVLFGFVETSDGHTTYERGREGLENLLAGHFYMPPAGPRALPPHTP